MESTTDTPPLIVIVGETASGKTALAIQLAQRFNGEIIAADSRTVYRGMNIGTAKPTAQEMNGIPHYLLDVVDPDQPFTAADFKRLAEEAIDDIVRRSKLPIIVGGTGLYVDSVLYDFSFGGAPDSRLRAELQKMTVAQLQDILRERDIPLPQNNQNPRHLVRAIENNGQVLEHHKLRPHTLILGLHIDRDLLERKVAQRVDAMVEQGLVDEVRRLGSQYGWDTPALQAPGYRAFHAYIDAEVSLEEAKAQFVRNDLQLAKRQRTWFKRNKSIQWISNPAEAVDIVTTFLGK